MKNKKGFTMIEALIALWILVIITSISFMIIKNMKYVFENRRFSDDLIMIQQIRRELLLHDKIEIKNDCLYMDDEYLQVHNHRLVKRKGYMIYLEHIDEGYFDEKRGMIYFIFTRGQATYEVALTKS